MGTEDLSVFNSSYLCLIPKKKTRWSPGDFRPINLCNVIYKILTKIVVNRLAAILLDIIEENQGGFIQGRGISCNAIIVFEILDSILKRIREREGQIITWLLNLT